MGKEKQQKRFVQIFEEGFNLFGPESSLVVDRQTGVTYLIIRNTFGSGITPLLSADGQTRDYRSEKYARNRMSENLGKKPEVWREEEFF